VESLELQKGGSAELSVECVIVDNSTNEQEAADCEELSKNHSWVTYIRAPVNLGYFGGLNYGISMDDPARAAYVVICNNDVQFDDEFCYKLSRKTYDSIIFSVCPDVITADGRHENPHFLKRISWFRRLQFDLYFSHYYMAQLLSVILRILRPVKTSPPQSREGCEIHMGVGDCYILTAEFFRQFKKLNYPHFLYGEESYISDQIHAAGGILWFDPELRVRHALSAALSKVPKRTAYEFARSGYPYYRKLL
jgi:GT2 family glycosyltransferase